MTECEICGRKLTRQYRMCKKCAFVEYYLDVVKYYREEE